MISDHVEWANVSSRRDASGSALFTIGELSQEFDLTLRALRFYEDKGLITPQRRGITRLYTAEDRERIALIVRAKKLGFTLNEIRDLVAGSHPGGDAASLNLSRERCLEQINLLEKQKHQIESALAELRKVYSGLTTVSFNDQA